MVSRIGEILDGCSRVSSRRHCVVIPTDVAVYMLREIVFAGGRMQDVVIRGTDDELFTYRDYSVKLRANAQPGVIRIIPYTDLTERSCCDKTAAATLSVSLCRGTA